MGSDEKKFLTPKKVEEDFGLNARWLANLRWMGAGPRYLKLRGKKILYRPEDVVKWIEKNSAEMKTATTEISGADIGM